MIIIDTYKTKVVLTIPPINLPKAIDAINKLQATKVKLPKKWVGSPCLPRYVAVHVFNDEIVDLIGVRFYKTEKDGVTDYDCFPTAWSYWYGYWHPMLTYLCLKALKDEAREGSEQSH